MLCSACPATFDEENCTYDRDTDTCHRQRAENEREETKMTDKLILTDVREGNKKRGTQVNIYDDTHELLKNLNARTGQSITLLANRLIKFAYNHVVIDSEETAE